MRVAPIAVLLTMVALVALATLSCGKTAPPRFAHEAHLAVTACGGPGQPKCPTCASCHAGVKQVSGQALPTPSTCAECHRDPRHLLARATTREPDERAIRENLRFEHAGHLPLKGINGQCHKCHAGISEDGAAGHVFPTMDSCLECHDGELQRGVCASCHRRSNLKQLVPRAFLRHDLEFLRDHGAVATQRAAICNQCHGETFCSDCHDSSQTLPVAARAPEAIARELIHRGDFSSRHPIEARSQPGRCLSCHETSSCEGCHLERGVSAGRKGSINPHPVGWVGPNAGSEAFHGRQARRELLSCAACHDRGPATNCIRCHKVGGPGANPHPAGWRSGRSEDASMCRYCHAF